MAIDTIKSTAVLDGAIATADIADDAVTTDKLANAINTDIAAKSPLANPAFTGKVGIGTSSTIDLTGNASPSLTMSSNGPYICLQDANNADQVTYMANNHGELQFGKVTDDGSTTKAEHLRHHSIRHWMAHHTTVQLQHHTLHHLFDVHWLEVNL